MPNCEDSSNTAGIIFKSWSGDVIGNKECTIGIKGFVTNHCIQIINLRSSTGFIINASGYAGNSNNIGFESASDNNTSSTWKAQSIKIPPYSKRSGIQPYTKDEAVIKSVTKSHGTDNIITEFSYSYHENYPFSDSPVKMAFNVNF